MRDSGFALFVVASAVSGALAQFDSSLPTSTGFSVDQCIYGCISTAASSAGCLGLGDYECICGSSKYQDSANSCLQQCTKADADWGKAWYQDTCAYQSTLEDIVSDYSTYTAAVGTISVSNLNSAQLSSLEVEASTFAAHLSSELSVATASYSSAYALLSSSASVLLTAASETASSTSVTNPTTTSHPTSATTSPSSTHSTSATISTTSVTTTSNAASGLRVMMQGGAVACATVVLSLFFGSSLALV